MQYNLKKMKMLSLASVLAAVVGLGSCTDDFKDINTDTTKLSVVSTAEFPYMFSNALMASSLAPNNFEIGEGTYAGVYSQFYSQAAMSFPTDRYVMRLDWLPAAWNPIYIQSAPALKTILENTDESSPENALAKIWWVWMFHRVTDYFGPIPYTQAANGLGEVASTPQDSIYYDFFKKLDAASTVLKNNAGKAPYGKFDLIYNAKGTAGATAAWMKFANTLRLRLALRISKVDPARAKTEAEAAVAGGVMTETTDDAFMPKSNTVYAEYNGLSQIVAWDEIRMSSTMESILKGYDDPRMPIYFQPASFTGKYDGVRNGLLVAEKQMDINSRKYTSNLGSRWATGNNGSFTAVFNTPQNILHAAEAYFLRAEGALNGWNMGDNAQNLYETGIKMSMKQWGITDQAVIAKYIANPAVPIAPEDGQNSPPVNDYPVKWSADATMQRKQVAQQKWLGLFPDAMEGWADVRRSGLPKLYPIVHSENTDLPQGTFIRRVPFLDTEKQTNAAATAKAVEMLKGPDKVSTPLWWDKN